MVSVCTVPARGGRSCEHFGGYKTINRIPLSINLCKMRIRRLQFSLYFSSLVLLMVSTSQAQCKSFILRSPDTVHSLDVWFVYKGPLFSLYYCLLKILQLLQVQVLY